MLSGVSYKDTSKPDKLVSLKKRLKEDSDIEVDTVHKFQGREKDTIIFSTVITSYSIHYTKLYDVCWLF